MDYVKMQYGGDAGILRQTDSDIVADMGDAPPTALVTKAAGIAVVNTQGTVVENNGAVPAIPTKCGTVGLTKSGVAEMTLADPATPADDGKELMIMDLGGHAHTVTNTPTGFNAAGAGGDVATFDAAKGSNLVLKAYKGVWYVKSLRGVTLG